jgi:hypothetical protein
VKKTVHANEDLIKAKTNELAILQQVECDSEREKEKQLAEEIHGLMEQEDLKWRQKAKENWLKNGDHNTKFSHACASQKRWRNVLEQIQDEEGHLCTEPADIEATFVRYHTKLFISTSPHNIERCISAIGKRVIDGMNEKTE